MGKRFIRSFEPVTFRTSTRFLKKLSRCAEPFRDRLCALGGIPLKIEFHSSGKPSSPRRDLWDRTTLSTLSV